MRNWRIKKTKEFKKKQLTKAKAERLQAIRNFEAKVNFIDMILWLTDVEMNPWEV